MSPVEWFENYLACSGSQHHGRMWQCPSHADSSPSLSITEGEQSRVLVKCFAGCATERVVETLGLSIGVLFERPLLQPESAWRAARVTLRYPDLKVGGSRGSTRPLGSPIDSVFHKYTSDVRLRRERFADGRKRLTWERRVGREWSIGKGLVTLHQLPLYREQEALRGALCGEEVIVCESESSVDALCDAGLYATTWAGGASSPNIERLTSVLSGHRVLLIPDNDGPGVECGHKIAAALLTEVQSLREILPAPGEDARDLLRRCGTTGFVAHAVAITQ